MKPYMFVIKAIPDPESRGSSAVAGAHVHCWVMSDSMESATTFALNYIKSHQWNPIECLRAFEIDPMQISGYHEDEIALYRRALVVGVAADFLGWTSDPGDLPEGSYIKIPLPKD